MESFCTHVLSWFDEDPFRWSVIPSALTGLFVALKVFLAFARYCKGAVMLPAFTPEEKAELDRRRALHLGEGPSPPANSEGVGGKVSPRYVPAQPVREVVVTHVPGLQALALSRSLEDPTQGGWASRGRHTWNGGKCFTDTLTLGDVKVHLDQDRVLNVLFGNTHVLDVFSDHDLAMVHRSSLKRLSAIDEGVRRKEAREKEYASRGLVEELTNSRRVMSCDRVAGVDVCGAGGEGEAAPPPGGEAVAEFTSKGLNRGVYILDFSKSGQGVWEVEFKDLNQAKWKKLS